MRLAVTGFVSAQAGSVASANALLLRAVLDRGCEVVFFSKASFVDPRPVVGARPRFEFVDVDNWIFDRLRACVARLPGVGFLARMIDAATYNRLLVRRIRRANAERAFDLCLWLGDYARGGIEGTPTVSFVQGPPGTDARSLISKFGNIVAVAGRIDALRWWLLAKCRLSRAGLPPFRHTDHFVVGSSQSRSTLRDCFGIPEDRVDALPYPIDLQMFRPAPPSAPIASLRCLWLGRIVPRKRLDLFLEAAAESIRRGVDLRITIVGGIGFVRGYETLIGKFPYADRLEWRPAVPREQVGPLIHEHDVLAQPSEEEDFGSSVAEAQACGLPVIVGASNGNRDYLCARDIVLADYRVETLAAAFAEMAARKREGRLGEPAESRRCAEQNFSIDRIGDRFCEILRSTRNKMKEAE